MFHIEMVTNESKDLDKIEALNQRAFPINERRPLSVFLKDQSGCSDFVAFYDDEEFCGFACLLTWQDITHILYFAIEESQREKGYGSMALQEMRKIHPGHRYIADIEQDSEAVENHEQRRKRKGFYMRNGYEETEVAYKWRKEKYEILSAGGTVTRQEFYNFWEYFDKVVTIFATY